MTQSVSNDVLFSRFFRANEEYRKHDKHGSIVTLQTFLLIAARGALTRKELAFSLSISGPSTSSALQRLSGTDPDYRPRWTEDPMHLTTAVAHPSHAGMKLAMLAPEGVQLVTRMRTALSG